MRRLLTGLLGAWLLISACGGDDDDGDRAAVTSIPEDTTSTSTTTTAPETVPPDVIPQDEALITEEYVEQVLNALFRSSNDALLLTMEAGLVDESVIEIVEATNTAEQARHTLNGLAELARSDFDGIVDSPTGLEADVSDVLSGSSRCIFAEIDVDGSGVTGTQSEASEGRSFAVLLPATEQQLTSDLNPTAWSIAGLPATTDDSVPASDCDSP